MVPKRVFLVTSWFDCRVVVGDSSFSPWAMDSAPAGVRVSIFTSWVCVCAGFRREDYHALVKAVKAGLPVTIDKLEAHYPAGGNVDQVIDASSPPTGRYSPDLERAAPLTWRVDRC